MSTPRFSDFYLETYGPFVRERRVGGSGGAVDLTEILQPAGDFPDAPVSDFVILRELRGDYLAHTDFGGGLFRTRAQRDDFYLVPPGTPTQVTVDGPNHLLAFALPDDVVRPLLEPLREGAPVYDFGRHHTSAFQSARLTALFDIVWAEAALSDRASRLAVDGAVLAILAEILRSAGRPPARVTGGLGPARLRRALEHLDGAVRGDPSLADLAGAVGLSPHHFARAFKTSTGLSPHTWLTRRRLQRAEEQMLGTTSSLAQIAVACGFASQQHFTTAFKRALGVPPAAWRRERRT